MAVVCQQFTRSRRLLTSADFGFVFDKANHKVSHKHYLILARRNEAPHGGMSRLGLVIAKKNIRLAARRTRIKRVARETFRKSTENLDTLDIVFMARRGFDNLEPIKQTQLMEEAWRKLARKHAHFCKDL